MMLRPLLLAVLVAGCASAQSPHALVTRALERLGAHEILRQGATIEGEGFVDLAVLQQGRAPGVAELAPYRETLTIAPGGAELAFQYDTAANTDARERLRYVVDARGVRGFVPDADIAFWETRTDMQPRLRALSPALLLQDALAQNGLRDLGGRRVGATIAGEDVELAFGPMGDLASISRVIDVPLRGPTRWRWSYLPPRQEAPFANYPGGYEVRFGDDVLRRVEYRRIAAGHGLLSAENAQDLSAEPPSPSTPPPLSFRELASNVFLARHVRPGFHHLVIDTEDYLIVVDAPAGWLETTLPPPMEWVEGATSSSISQNFVAALRERFPDRPIKLVLTHWHSDHAGGVRAFAEAGAEILGAAETRQAISGTLPDNALFTEVRDALVLAGAVHVIPVDNNPHAGGMLAVRLPAHELVYVADLFEAGSPDKFPSPARRDAMRWLVRWLDRNGMAQTTIISAHGGASQPWMLERLRELNALTPQ